LLWTGQSGDEIHVGAIFAASVQTGPLLIFEREIFRRIYSPKYEDGEWKSRTN
jgi:hypothetical protein